MLRIRPGLSALLALLLGVTGSMLLPTNDVLALPSYGPDTPDVVEGESTGLIVITEEVAPEHEDVLDDQHRLVDEEVLFEPDVRLLDAIDELAGEEIPMTGEGAVDVEAVIDDAGIDFDEATPIADRVWVVETDSDTATLQALPGVAAVEEDFAVAPAAEDPHLSQQWGLHNFGQTVAGSPGIATADIGWRAAQTRFDGSGVVVAVVDSGIELMHPDLVNSIWANTDEVCGNGLDDDANGYVDDCNGYDFINRDGTPFDQRTRTGLAVDNNHGTHVAGIIAAATSNATGVAGVASGARIMSVKVFENGGTSISTIIQGIDYASSNGADIINLSLGSSPGAPYSQALHDAVARAGARGSLVVAAAGNSGVDIDRSAVWPASLTNPNLITVGASTNRDARASFSNFGAVGVDVFAPGQSIVSSVGGGGYAFYDGTSMAAPMVSGIAALLAQASGTADPVELRALLLGGAVPVSGFTGIAATGGRASAGAALGYAALEDGSVAFTADGLGGWISGPVDAMLTAGSPRAAELGTDLRLTLGVVVVDGSFAAVIGHELSISIDGAGGRFATSDQGAVALALTDSARRALAIGTLRIGVGAELPHGDYALHLAGSTSSGTELTGQMVRFRVGSEPLPAPAPPATGGGAGSGDNGSPVPAPPGGSTGGGDTVTPTPAPGGSTGGGTAPGGSSGGSSGGGGSTVSQPPSGGSSGGSTGGSTGGGETTAPPPAPGGSTGGGSTGGGSTDPGTPASSTPGSGGSTDGGGSVGGGGSDGGDTPAPVGSTAVSPGSGPTSGGTLVRIEGSFTGVRSVSFGGSPSPFVFAASSFLLAESPRRAPGTVDIAVLHSGGETVFPGAFTYLGDGGSTGGSTGGGSTGGSAGGDSTGGGSAGGGSTGGGSTGGGSTGGGSTGGGVTAPQPASPVTQPPAPAPAPTPPTTVVSSPPPVMEGNPRTLGNGLTVDGFGAGHPLGGSVRGSACGGDDCRSFRP